MEELLFKLPYFYNAKIPVMAKTEHYYTQFQANHFYHVYNRTVNKENLFRSEQNYQFFLTKYDYYLSPVIETYAYCLLNNHFHLLIRIKDKENLKEFLMKNGKSKEVYEVVSHQFRKLFQSYAMAFNKQYERVGTLFQTPFKRVHVDNVAYYRQLIFYIHHNPQKHGLIDDFKNWKWSSYHSLLSPKRSKLRRQEVLNWFGNEQIYYTFHQTKQPVFLEEKMLLED